MLSALISSTDGPAAITVGESPEPEPAPGMVVIDVVYAGVSFPDVLLSRGEYQLQPPLPFIPGSEVAGVVRSAPDGSALAAGDAVAAFPMLGGFAETVAVPAPMVFALPDGVALDVGAALPMNYFTMDFALRRRAALQPGQTVLVQGAAGGLGTAAIQLARALEARVIAVVSTPAKAEVARAAGAHDTVPADGFASAVKDLTGGRGVDLVVDPVGGDRFTDSLRCLAPEGALLVLGFTGGEIPTIKVNRLLLANTSLIGVNWGGFWMRQPEFLAEQWQRLAPLVASGALAPPIGAVYPLREAAAAVESLAARSATGKVLLRVR